MALSMLILNACTGKADQITSQELEYPNGAIMLIVKAKTELPDEDFLRIAHEREAQFEAIPGLIQKYYIKTNESGEYGGVYIWDSMESLKKFRESDLAATIGQAYQTVGNPSMEVVDIMFELRD